MPRRIVGVRLESLGLPIRQAIAAAGSLGVDGVEFAAEGELAPRELSASGRRELLHVLATNGLRDLGIVFPARHGFDEVDRLDERLAAAADALSFARELGCDRVIGNAGRLPEDPNSAEAAPTIDALRRLGSEADRVGARFAIQTGPDRPELLAAILGAVASYGLAVNFNPVGLLLTGTNLAGAAETLAGSIIGVHARDAIRSGLSASGLREATVGSGEVGWPQLLSTLDDIGFPGPFTAVRSPASVDTDLAAAIAFFTD